MSYIGLFVHAWPQLFLNNNEIGDTGAVELAKAIQANSTLTVVLRCGCLRLADISEHGNAQFISCWLFLRVCAAVLR